MVSCDVLIVGGGPAGSSCAWELRRSGLNVVILDKEVFPRDKVCGGWITPGVLTDLQIDAGDYARGRMMQPITRFRVGRIDGTAREADYGRPVSYGILRREFDHYLLRRCHAGLFPGSPLTSLERYPNEWIANEQIRARMVIGAGGHFCPVARLTRARDLRESAVVAQEAEFEMDSRQLSGCNVAREVPELYFCRDMKGYGWCFRKGNFLNVGLGRADPHGLAAHVRGFLEFLRTSGRILFDIPALRGHAYLLEGTSTRTVVGDGVLLVGDAAGLAEALSGEGIGPAIQSGLQAARNIIAARGVYTRERLEAYHRRHSGSGRSGGTHLIPHLPGPLSALLGRKLLSTEWFVRNVVLNDWFLHGAGC